MDLKHLITLAFQLSILAIVFGFGLKARIEDLLYMVRRPGLLARSLLAMFVVMPLVAVLLARAFEFPHTVNVALTLLAISPLPPLIPGRLARLGGRTSHSIALMATVALLSIVIVPLLVELLERYLGQPLAALPSTVATVIAVTVLLPLIAGMVFRVLRPALADRIELPISLGGNVLLRIAVLVLLSANLLAIWALVRDGTIIAIVIFVAAGLAVGHLFGGPEPGGRTVLALAGASRHPAIALTIAAANFPGEHFEATILLYLLVGAIVGMPYTIWRRRITVISRPNEQS